jgi:hypothetical protein
MDQLEGRIAKMIARGFKPVAWVAAIGTAALGCYMLSLQVAAERAELAGVERRIVATQQQIRTLQTELGTRGRLQQLEQWNAEILALSAPAAGQFLESTVSLARFDVGRGPAPIESEVRLASADAATPAARPVQRATPPASPAPARPAVRLASAEAAPPTPTLAAASAVAAPQRPAVRRASLEVVAPAPPTRTRSVEPRRPTALLDDGTIRALRSQARSEQGGGTRN